MFDAVKTAIAHVGPWHFNGDAVRFLLLSVFLDGVETLLTHSIILLGPMFAACQVAPQALALSTTLAQALAQARALALAQALTQALTQALA